MTRLISVRDEVYELLVGLKRTGESFSSLFLRLTKEAPKTSIMELAGAWKDREEIDGIFKEILERKSNRKPVRF